MAARAEDDPALVKHFCTGLRKPVDNAEDNLADQAEKLKQEGNTLFKSGPEKYDAALEKYTTALELAGGRPSLCSVLLSNRALLNLHKGRFEEALDDAKKSVQANPGNGKAYVRAGQACQKTSRPRMAATWLNLAIERADTRRAKALAAGLLKKMVEAEQKRIAESKSRAAEVVADSAGVGSETTIGTDGQVQRRTLSHAELKNRKARFDAIIKRYKLDAAEPQEAIAEYLTSLNGKVATAKDFVKRFPFMSESEAVDFLTWIQTGLQFKESVLDKNRQAAAAQSIGLRR